MRSSIYPPCNTPPYQCSLKASFLGLRSIWETGNPGFYLDMQHTLRSCPSSGYHIHSPLWLLLTASLQESRLISCQCVHVCTLTCTWMQVCICVCVSMCRSEANTRYLLQSLSPSFLEHSLSPNLEWSVLLGWVTSEHERSGYLCFSNPGTIGNCQYNPLLKSVLGSSLLCTRYFTSWTTSPALKLAFIINVTSVGIPGWAPSELLPALNCMVKKTPLCASPTRQSYLHSVK